MELTPKQQVTELVRKFNRILLVTHARPDGDALGSILALQQVLTALKKEATAVIMDPVPEMLGFLPGLDQISPTLQGNRDLILSIDTSKVPVDKLKYNTADNKLNVVITPKEGSYTEKDVSVSTGGYKFDVVIVLDAPDLDRLGKLYDESPDLFYETPVINIDHHPSNDYFGAVNLVDLTATSTSEILVGVVEALGENLMTEDVATALLTGVITDTGSFQNSNTTPKSLTVSAQLVAAGGRQQEIIQHVYKTKPLSTLKLWGRALTKLQYDPAARLVWSSLSAKDFSDTGGTPTEAKQVIDALMSSAPDAEIILLLRENEGKVDGSVRTAKGVDATKVVGFWNGGGHTGAAGFDVPGPIEEAEAKVVKQIKSWQLERLEGSGEISEEAPVKQPDQKRPAPDRKAPAKTPSPQATTPAPETSRPPANQPQPAPDAAQATPAGDSPAAGVAPATDAAAPAAPATTGEQAPLTDEQLDAYFRKTSGGKDGAIEQPQAKSDE